jgi:hypothetical protein
VHIYFLSNEKNYRSPAVQLDLTLPSIRQQFLKHDPKDQRYLDHPSLKTPNTRAWDMTEQAGEVVIPGRIPTRRVLGRCTLTDLQTNCDMDWWFPVLRSTSTYEQAVRQLPINDKAFLQKVALSARKLRPLCEIRETAIASLTDKVLFNALIDGLNKSRNVSLWTPAKEVWDDIGKGIEGASNSQNEPVDVEDLDGMFSSMSLGSRSKSQKGTFY